MATKTKIFISSSSQPELTSLRNDVFVFLNELGHEPMMFEKNFGPWTIFDRNSIYRCLRMVSDSNIFLLFIHNKAGTYLKHEKKTVTHLEFLKAFDQKKLILVFVEKNIIQTYFNRVKQLIDESITKYIKASGSKPNQDVMLEFASKATDAISRPEIDPYIWLFIRDIVEKNMYCENFELGMSVRDLLKDYLSDMLRGGSLLIPFEQSIDENVRRLSIYEDFDELVQQLLGTCKYGMIDDWRSFLTLLREKMKGGVITLQDGQYLNRTLGTVKDCSAITIYRREDKSMLFVEKSGHAGGEKKFQLDDDSSYISITYRTNSECLFWREDKKMFYLTTRVGESVMSFHFPYDNSWKKQHIIDSQNDILNGIMKLQGNALNLKLVKLLLGGLPL